MHCGGVDHTTDFFVFDALSIFILCNLTLCGTSGVPSGFTLSGVAALARARWSMIGSHAD